MSRPIKITVTDREGLVLDQAAIVIDDSILRVGVVAIPPGGECADALAELIIGAPPPLDEGDAMVFPRGRF